MKLKRNEAKNIAKVMIASAGLAFDQFAFDDCIDMIDPEDVDNIIHEIKEECTRIITKMSERLNVEIDYNSTEAIIETMYFES